MEVHVHLSCNKIAVMFVSLCMFYFFVFFILRFVKVNFIRHAINSYLISDPANNPNSISNTVDLVSNILCFTCTAQGKLDFLKLSL